MEYTEHAGLDKDNSFPEPLTSLANLTKLKKTVREV